MLAVALVRRIYDFGSLTLRLAILLLAIGDRGQFLVVIIIMMVELGD